ncbi:MAG: hypothetical protein IPO83_03880 [Chitinophagaceae bacterium]|nr:hypothetical protein [Chitinophagaceae bacterium]
MALVQADFKKLILHIQANKNYYINSILLYEDTSDRLIRLKAHGLLDYVENELLGFTGDFSVFPLNIENLDASTKRSLLLKFSQFNPDDEKLGPSIKEKAEEFNLPTSGVYIESILGKCDALEPYLLERREIEKEMAKIQNNIAAEKLNQLKKETERMQKRLESDQLSNPNLDLK